MQANVTYFHIITWVLIYIRTPPHICNLYIQCLHKCVSEILWNGGNSIFFNTVANTCKIPRRKARFVVEGKGCVNRIKWRVHLNFASSKANWLLPEKCSLKATHPFPAVNFGTSIRAPANLPSMAPSFGGPKNCERLFCGLTRIVCVRDCFPAFEDRKNFVRENACSWFGIILRLRWGLEGLLKKYFYLYFSEETRMF